VRIAELVIASPGTPPLSGERAGSHLPDFQKGFLDGLDASCEFIDVLYLENSNRNWRRTIMKTVEVFLACLLGASGCQTEGESAVNVERSPRRPEINMPDSRRVRWQE
jgi:hypothetical protein